MDFLGIGPMELMVILVIALIVFGPQRLPEIAAQVAKFMNQMRQTGVELTRELNRELEESKKAVTSVTDEVKQTVIKTASPIFEEEDEKMLTQPGAVASAQPGGSKADPLSDFEPRPVRQPAAATESKIPPQSGTGIESRTRDA